MSFDRRSVLLGSIAAIAMPSNFGYAADDERPAFASAARKTDGSFSLVLLSAAGRLLRDVPLSARGHDVAIHANSGRAVVFARRPGTFAVAFETKQASEPYIIAASDGRHFFGHGAFSVDGRLLYVSENDIAGARGVMGIYDVARGYRKIGEHQSYGLGPHEVIMLADGKTLAIANGGLDTSPEAGRENLNRDAMDASLTFVDAETGQLRARHTLQPDLKQLSLRHIAADKTGRVWFGGQWEGDPGTAPGLIGRVGVYEAPEIIEAPADTADYLKGYIGSVAMSADGRIFAASAPKAGRVVYLDTMTKRVVSESLLKDVCGIAGELGGTFAATSGFGVLRHETAQAQVLSECQLAELSYDNHLRRIG